MDQNQYQQNLIQLTNLSINLFIVFSIFITIHWTQIQATTTLTSTPTPSQLLDPTPTLVDINTILQKLTINEVFACPSTNNSEWVEILYTGNPVFLENIELWDNNGKIANINEQLETNTFSLININSKLNNNGDSVILKYNGQIIDQMSYPSCQENQTWIKINNQWITSTIATPKTANPTPTPTPTPIPTPTTTPTPKPTLVPTLQLEPTTTITPIPNHTPNLNPTPTILTNYTVTTNPTAHPSNTLTNFSAHNTNLLSDHPNSLPTPSNNQPTIQYLLRSKYNRMLFHSPSTNNSSSLDRQTLNTVSDELTANQVLPISNNNSQTSNYSQLSLYFIVGVIMVSGIIFLALMYKINEKYQEFLEHY